MDEDVLQYLKDNLFLVTIEGQVLITNKFIRAVGARSITTKDGDSKQPIRVSPIIDYTTLYKQFIVEAEVPSKITTSNGSSYWANRYSKKGEDAFRKVISDSSIDKKILLTAAKYYYKQTNTARVMIANFFIEGIWVSFYDEVKRAVESKGLIKIEDDKDKGRNSIRL